MASQVNLSVESPIAEIALKRLEPRMFAHVRDQVRRLAEWFCACATTIRFFSCVNIGVLLHIRFLVKSLAAILAWKRPRIRVDHHMSRQCGGALEAFPAVRAVEASQWGVDGLAMLLQAHFVSESFSALLALVWTQFTGMRAPNVHFKSVNSCKCLLALSTREVFLVL